MKKAILFGLAVCALPALGHSQSNTTQLPNGVIVHQAQGVEKTPEAKTEKPVLIRTLQDLTLPECIEALTHTEIKLNEASEADRERYLTEKARIIQRINELKAAN